MWRSARHRGAPDPTLTPVRVTARWLRSRTTMVEIEWDGVDLASDARRTVLDRLRGLAVLVDPDGRARVRVEIVRERAGYSVVVAGGDDLRRMGAEVRDRDLMGAVQRAIDLTVTRWRALRDRAA